MPQEQDYNIHEWRCGRGESNELIDEKLDVLKDIRDVLQKLTGVVTLNKGWYTNSLSITDEPVLIHTAQERKTVNIYNPYSLADADTQLLYIGDSGVTTATGILLPREGIMTFVVEPDVEIYAVVATAVSPLNITVLVS